MKIKVFGPNLRDQRQAQFQVHAADCKDCGKLKNEICHEEDVSNQTEDEFITEFFSDFIAEGYSADSLRSEFWFNPCVKFKS